MHLKNQIFQLTGLAFMNYFMQWRQLHLSVTS